MATDRFTRFGLAVAILGWILLIADAVLSPIFLSGGNLASVLSLRSDIFSIAETTIFSGFALALLGALRAGFGALSKFFDAVLERSSAPRPTAAAVRVEPQPMPTAPPIEIDEQAITVSPMPAAPHPKPQTHGGRNYVILPNGAVEVETLLGTRVFASMTEARDYIK